MPCFRSCKHSTAMQLKSKLYGWVISQKWIKGYTLYLITKWLSEVHTGPSLLKPTEPCSITNMLLQGIVCLALWDILWLKIKSLLCKIYGGLFITFQSFSYKRNFCWQAVSNFLLKSFFAFPLRRVGSRDEDPDVGTDPAHHLERSPDPELFAGSFLPWRDCFRSLSAGLEAF